MFVCLFVCVSFLTPTKAACSVFNANFNCCSGVAFAGKTARALIEREATNTKKEIKRKK